MKYPNGIDKKNNKNVNYANRGMDLEYLINIANLYYLENNIAIVYKKATPITVLKTNNKKITDGFYKEKSTLDYVGLYKGKYIEFDAKETSLSSLPLSNIHIHQIEHIKKINNHGGISFLIINIKNEYYLLNGLDFINYIENNNRKSIPYTFIKEAGKVLKYNYLKGLDYIDKLEDKIEKDKN